MNDYWKIVELEDKNKKLQKQICCLKDSLNVPIVSELSTWRNASNVGYDPTYTDNNDNFSVAGSYLYALGHVYIPDGLPKTISSAGGSILFQCMPFGNVWANSVTRFRTGIEDSTANGNWNGTTWTTYGEISPVTTPLVAGQTIEIPISSGSKNLVPGQLIAIPYGLSAKGGTDNIRIAANSCNFNTIAPDIRTPNQTSNYNNLEPIVALKFDDGSYGSLYNSSMGRTIGLIHRIAENPNEYGTAFTPQKEMLLRGVSFYFGGNNLMTDRMQLNVFSSPLTTPVLQYSQEFTFTSYTQGLGYGWINFQLETPLTLTAGTQYAITEYASVGTLYINLSDFQTLPNEAFVATSMLGSTYIPVQRVRGANAPFVQGSKSPMLSLQFLA